jgi:hypothetical protein
VPSIGVYGYVAFFRDWIDASMSGYETAVFKPPQDSYESMTPVLDNLCGRPYKYMRKICLHNDSSLDDTFSDFLCLTLLIPN